MEYALKLSWPEARALADAGSLVRRINWTDRWLFKEAGIWWVQLAAGSVRVVQAYDFTAAEFRAGDWTTIWPDQYSCVVVEPPPPPPEDPEPPGGPIRQRVEFSGKASRPRGPFQLVGPRYGFRRIANPFSAGCVVDIEAQGLDDGLDVNGIEVTNPRGSYYYGYGPLFHFTLALAAGGSFSIAAVDHYGGDVNYYLNLTFTL